MKVVVDFTDDESVNSRIRVDDKHLKELKEIAKKILTENPGEYTVDDLEEEIERRGIEVEYLPIVSDYEICF